MLKGKMLHKVLFMVFIGSVLAGCGSGPESVSNGGKRPQWLDNPSSVYPEGKYLTVVSSGDSLKKAKANAASDLSMIFKNKVTVDSTMQSRFDELREDGVLASVSESTSVSETINQQSEQELTNMKYGESWVNDMGKTFVIGYLDRMETGNIYKVRIEDQAKIVGHLIGRANNQDSLMASYAYLDAAFAVAMQNEVLIEQLDIISPAIKRTIYLGYKLGDLKADRADIAASMTFNINITGDSTERVIPLVEGVITDAGFGIAANGDGKVAVDGEFTMNKVDRSNDFVNYKWYLNLSVVNDKGNPVVSFEGDKISAGLTETAAVSRTFKDLEREIQRQFGKKLNSYFNSFMKK